MRYCTSCRKITTGNPSYCNYCGKSYNVKLCGRGHPNTPAADVCSTCGSRDLSVPQRRPSWKLRIFQIGALGVPFIGLLVISFGYIGVFLQALWTNSSELLPLMILGLPLGLLWLIWIHLSAMLRELLFGSRSRNMRR